MAYSATLELDQNTKYTFKLEQAGYDTLTFDHTTGTTDASIAKTLKLSRGTLSISTTPTGAAIAVVKAGLTITTETSPFTKSLPVGTYAVRVTKAGYTAVTDAVTISAGITTSKSYTLTLTTGTLSVTTSPTGASVKVGATTKTSPCTFTLTPGTHSVTITKAGYDSIVASVPITAGVTLTKSYTLRATPGSLSVSTTPTAATVVIAGVGTYTTPFTKKLTAGSYPLTISKTGYVTKTDSITIAAGQIMSKSYTLVKKKVKVTITANTPAKVYKDGVYITTLS